MSAFSKWQVAEMTKNPHIFLEMPTLDVSALGIGEAVSQNNFLIANLWGKSWSSLDFEPVLMPLLLKSYRTHVLGNTKGNSWPWWEVEPYKGIRDSIFFFPLGMVVPAVRV